jgi:stage II sporulation protein AA (anti-sigma F factor antagonist)
VDRVDDVPSEVDEPLSIEVADDGTETVFVLRGELDPHTAPSLRGEIDRVLAAGRVHLVLDLSGLSFIDSSGLRVIISAHKDTADRDGHLVLRSPSPTTRRLLDITGLLDHIDTRE